MAERNENTISSIQHGAGSKESTSTSTAIWTGLKEIIH